jgi:class 3 adenylate cyclase
LARQVLLSALAQDPAPQTQPVAVLIADLSGYTAIAERMDAEQVREAMNAMWLELDGVITAWGGRIEQHAGDSLVALFGLPWARPSDTWRAVQAAQSLHLALLSFNDRVRQQAVPDDHAAWLDLWPGPQMRVGVHAGPVAVIDDTPVPRVSPGETLRLAYELEEAAPPGAILVSDAVQAAVRDVFRLDPARPRRTPQPSYLVGPPKPREPAWQPGAVAGSVPRLVGRAEALEALGDAFQRAVDARGLEIITVVGDVGAGKSRLAHEFLPQLQILSPNALTLRSQLPVGAGAAPFAVVRDLLQRYLALYPIHGSAAVRARLAAWSTPNRLPDPAEARALLEALLLPGEAVPALTEVAALARALLLEMAGDAELVIVVDDLHHVDAYSLALLDRLLHDQPAVPVLFVALTEPSLLDDPAAAAVSWLVDLTDPFLPASRLRLSPLSPVESRLLAADLLRAGAPLPQRLIDLIVADAHGNPWAIEETVRHFIDLGLILPGVRWGFDALRAETLALPRTLPELIAARLAQLSPDERTVLGAAAATGVTFRDSELFPLLTGLLSPPAVLAALDRLAAAGWLAVDPGVGVEGQGYVFPRPIVRETALAGHSAPGAAAAPSPARLSNGRTSP